MRNLLLTGALAFVVLHSAAQSDNTYDRLKARFNDEPAVFVERSETLNILVEGDSLHVYTDVVQELMHLKDQTDQYAITKVYGSHFSEVTDLRAKTFIWDKGKYREANVTDFKKNSSQSGSVFYDDSYHYSFHYPSIAAHNRTQLQYREVQKDPRFLPEFFFASYLPQERAQFTIRTTKDVDIAYTVLHDPDNTIQFRKVERGKFIYYEWSAANVPALKFEDGSPSINYFTPHILLYVKSYQTRRGKVDVLSDLNALYKWYQTFTKDLNKESSPELAAIVQNIKAKSATEFDIVKNIFYWVQDNIEYIAFEQGMRGFIPHPGSYTSEKRYGDCKDMANLIVNMLELAGVKSYHTWIGSRDLPYKYTEFPSPLVDNHMIATYISPAGEYYYLDATSDYTPIGYPSSMIQGKEALIAISPTQFEVRSVPVITKEKNVMTDSMTIELADNQIQGKGKSSFDGFAKVFSAPELDRAEVSNVKKYVTTVIGKGNNKFFLDNYKVSGIADREHPTNIAYDFRISDYYQHINDELYINLNLNKDYYNNFINLENRKAPREADYKFTKYEFIELKIPSDYTVEYLPEPATYDGHFIGYDISYKENAGKIVFTKKMYVDYLLMEPNDFKTWNEEVKKISEAYIESIILKHK